ncbi:uncharacterized protein LOC131335467 [Rhododendron vialii]|uniref:uncharacterized protein LOC131335467 n=1 Tax=Rhododendron vialii TaxID=182163 RepID=UPI00265D82E8|nr:uncharacterized protein LOC131335467 [Rhododendron vialii]
MLNASSILPRSTKSTYVAFRKSAPHTPLKHNQTQIVSGALQGSRLSFSGSKQVVGGKLSCCKSSLDFRVDNTRQIQHTIITSLSSGYLVKNMIRKRKIQTRHRGSLSPLSAC